MSLTVEALAQEIRKVDGDHSLGASELAEALMPFLAKYVKVDESHPFWTNRHIHRPPHPFVHSQE